MTDILKLLDSLNIKYTRLDHPPVYTCADADKYWINSKAAHTKNLFLKTQKTSHHYFLYILACSQRADLKQLAKSLNLSSRLTFASDQELKAILGLTPGSVSPFGLINDKNHLVTVLVDQRLTTKDKLLFHPNTNTATLEISLDDFLKFLSHTNHQLQTV